MNNAHLEGHDGLFRFDETVCTHRDTPAREHVLGYAARGVRFSLRVLIVTIGRKH
ncbi:hypothetical protein HMPREF9061_01277 [Actinomyces sp. oral taxon 181 str. F0379]|nr:hypothetical protein HMPREF9061_01277 [Actinomyces sp. oral taxon 181 str. F0379]